MNTVNNIRSRLDNNKSSSLFEMTLLSSGEKEKESSQQQQGVQVEPKTYFANERTFIQWISAALLLLTVSSIMMTGNSADGHSYNGTSSVIAFSSLVLVAYAAFVYFRRVELLKSGSAYGYLDHMGPTILAMGVGLGVFIVFADAIKGSEFLPWGADGGKDKDKDDDRRILMAPAAQDLEVPSVVPARPLFENAFELEEVKGICSRYSINGINLLEYQPRDIITLKSCELELIVATEQALVSHQATSSTILSEIPDTELQSLTMVDGVEDTNRLFALSTGPTRTELIEFNFNIASASAQQDVEVKSRFLISDKASTAGSMVFLPSGKFYIYLDGTMHSYHLPSSNKNNESSSASQLSRTGSMNMKVLNRGGLDNDDDQIITAMEHFEGITYVLRERQNMIEAWDFETATLLAEMTLPSTTVKGDKWVGMTFERHSHKDEDEERGESLLRKNKVAAKSTDKSVYLHMPLDTFPPQLWSFRMEEHHDTAKEVERKILSFPECGGVAMN